MIDINKYYNFYNKMHKRADFFFFRVLGWWLMSIILYYFLYRIYENNENKYIIYIYNENYFLYSRVYFIVNNNKRKYDGKLEKKKKDGKR